MNIRKIYMATLGLLLMALNVCAQQDTVMYYLNNSGEVKTIPMSSVERVSFHCDDNLFAFTLKTTGITDNSATGYFTVALSAETDVKSLSASPEIGICYSEYNTVPTVNDACQKLRDGLGTQDFTVSGLDAGTKIYYRLYAKFGNQVFYSPVGDWTTTGVKIYDKVINGHQFRDLGLPSGLLWAETNIGAEKAEDYGGYYAWGEKETRSRYDWSTYTYTGISKYNDSDSLFVLKDEDDVAFVNWGDSCHIPTVADIIELSEYTERTWEERTNSSGETIKGYKVVSKVNGNSIFMPASGMYYTTFKLMCGDECLICPNSRYATDCKYIQCYNLKSGTGNNYSISQHERCYGFTIRAVAHP